MASMIASFFSDMVRASFWYTDSGGVAALPESIERRCEMQISDIINTVLCILSFLLAAISVVTVMITLRQNNRMLENSTRPYVMIYGGITAVHGTQVYLVLRNYGQISALITDFSCNVDLSKCTALEDGPVPFAHIVGHTIAPNQAIHDPINYLNLKQLCACPTFSIQYSANGKTYSETAVVNLPAHGDVLFSHAGEEAVDSRVISNTLQEMLVYQL